jgi:hypothetical protein
MDKATEDFIVLNQLSIMNDCFNCSLIDELCFECLDNKEALDSFIAHQIIDKHSEAEKRILSRISDEPSGHDWVSNKTRRPDGTIRREQKKQVYDINNRLPSWLFLGQHIFPLLAQNELDAYLALPSTDTICVSCHLQINRFVGCFNH